MGYVTKYIYKKRLDDNNVLLVNTLTSAIDLIDNEINSYLDRSIKQDANVENIDENTYNLLKQRGYIFDSEEEESNAINNMFAMSRAFNKDRINTSFTICPTMGCNLRCTYCFESNDQHCNNETLTDEQLNVIFQYIKEQCAKFKEKYDKVKNKEALKSHEPVINLFGGEPLLVENEEIILKVLNFARSINIPVKIITNGTTIDHYYDILNEYRDILSIQITVDGDQSIHNQRRIYADGAGTFDQICDGIDKVLSLGIHVALRINVDKENIKDLDKLERVCREHNWINNPLITPYASPVQDFAGCSQSVFAESEMLQLLYDYGYYGSKDSFIKHIVCSAVGFVMTFFESNNDKVKPWKMTYCEATSGNNYCFAPDGTITTCLTYIGKGKFNIATFDSDGVHINEDNYKMWIERSAERMENCRNCKFALFCGGGCPVAALERKNEIDCNVCSDIKRTLDVYVEHNKERFLNM